MKKSLIVLTAALSFGFAAAQTGTTASAPQVPTLTDVPAGHWAKDAIEKLTSKGVILGFPDGTFRGTQNLTRYEAAVIIARLLEQMSAGNVTVSDPEAVAALQNAIQELAADLTALGVRVSDMEQNAVSREDFARLEARIEELGAGNGEGTGNIQAQIDELTARLDEFDALRAQVEDNASNFEALNDLTVLLNQDVMNLTDRMDAVEEAQANFVQRADFDNLAGRVDKLENGRVSLTFGISGGYGRLGLIKGKTDFDIDRLTNGTFAAKVFSPDDTRDEHSVLIPDTTNSLQPSIGLTFGVKATNISAPADIFVEEAAINLGAFPARGVVSDIDGKPSNQLLVTLDNAAVTGRIGKGDNVARFRVIAKSYGNLALRPDVVNPVDKVKDVVGYNRYLLPNGARNGVSAGIAMVDWPLKPTLYMTAGYGDKATLKGLYYGARLEGKFLNTGTFGATFFQNDLNRTALSMDGKYDMMVKEGDKDRKLFGVEAVYVASMPDIFNQLANGVEAKNIFDNRDQAALVQAEADLFKVKLNANFRMVSPGFAEGVAGMDRAAKTPAYTDQVGYGVDLATNFNMLALGGYYDSFSNYFKDRDGNLVEPVTSFGAHVGAGLMGFKVTGYYRSTTLNNEAVFGVYEPKFRDPFVFAVSEDYGISDLFKYTSAYAVALTHEGAADNALVKNLNLSLAYAHFYPQGQTADFIGAAASYNGKLGGITFKPGVSYSSLKFDFAGNDAIAGQFNSLKYTLGLSTDPLNVAFKPSISAAFNGANHTLAINGEEAIPAATEMGGNVQVNLNEFFSPATKFSVGYGFHKNTNVGRANTEKYEGLSWASQDIYTSDVTGTLFDRKEGQGSVFGDMNTMTHGAFAQLSWNEALKFNYGLFFYDQDTSTDDTVNVAQGFRVSYGVKF